ncbi:nuclear transport factor 2 family protein [Altericroceibacterium spongiae]|uniref:Nuclear transport factor 2 family protein n=1 Tax=Altericroceibacterium spongiae TaxID=2320269 RepID=A0A420EQX4_9SPHN|nr:nuclear transport factor 2 family protein [Altericroceibacterium spongiae]RKF23077.1 nuclear transport factor 2 family protein [Altericroceibacterium spongiae]
MARKLTEISAQLVDREAIREIIARIARASDRVDNDLWRECFWPEACDQHAGMFDGTAIDLLEKATPFLHSLHRTTHFLGNTLFEFDGDSAKTETYVIAYHLTKDAEPLNVVACGRYLDIFERREEEWRVMNRHLVLDWFMNVPAEGDWSRPQFGHDTAGARKPDDYSCNFFTMGLERVQ